MQSLFGPPARRRAYDPRVDNEAPRRSAKDALQSAERRNIEDNGRPSSNLPSFVYGWGLKFVVTCISTSIGSQFRSVVLNCH